MDLAQVAPFGGIKQSGLGREGSHYGIDEYLEVHDFYKNSVLNYSSTIQFRSGYSTITQCSAR